MLPQSHSSGSTPNISPFKSTSTTTSSPFKLSTSNPNDTQPSFDPIDPNQLYFTAQSVPWFTTYRAGFVNTCVLLLTMAAILTIFFYFLIPTIPLIPYNKLSISLSILKTRLTIMKRVDYIPPAENETLEDRLLREVGIKEAESSLREAMNICQSSNCYQWISGAGYAHLQRTLNHVEEALIKFEPISILICEAKHDQAALREANISNNTQLSDALQQAIEDLSAHYSSPNQKKIYYIFYKKHLINFYITIRNSKLTLMHHWEKKSGRHALLFTTLDKHWTIFLSGTAYFIVGASAGLFGRLYNVSTANRTNNSYGLPTARINTVVHLWGIAGVGGVFVTQDFLSNHLPLACQTY